jgi:hypothetical protein
VRSEFRPVSRSILSKTIHSKLQPGVGRAGI